MSAEISNDSQEVDEKAKFVNSHPATVELLEEAAEEARKALKDGAVVAGFVWPGNQKEPTHVVGPSKNNKGHL